MSASRLVRRRVTVVLSLLALAVTVVSAQPRRPQADVTAVPPGAPVSPGSTVALDLEVVLPPDVHVQSDKPGDPLFIATVLTVDTPAGVTVDAITYPPAETLKQKGVSEPLLVFGSEFTIRVRVKVASTVTAGTLVVPARLRYQACDETTCYPPARAEASWALTVAARK